MRTQRPAAKADPKPVRRPLRPRKQQHNNAKPQEAKMEKPEKEIKVEVVRRGRMKLPLRRIAPAATSKVKFRVGHMMDALRDNKRIVFTDPDFGDWMQIQAFCLPDGVIAAKAQVYNAFNEACYYGKTPVAARLETPRGEEIDRETYIDGYVQPVRENNRVANVRQRSDGDDNARVRAVPSRVITCPVCNTQITLSGFGADGFTPAA